MKVSFLKCSVRFTYLDREKLQIAWDWGVANGVLIGVATPKNCVRLFWKAIVRPDVPAGVDGHAVRLKQTSIGPKPA